MDGEHINQAVFGSLKMYSPLPRSSLPAQGGRLLFKHQSLRPVRWGALPHLSCHGERKRGGGGKGPSDEEVFDGMVGAKRMKALLCWKRDPLGSQGFGEIWHREFGGKGTAKIKMFRCSSIYCWTTNNRSELFLFHKINHKDIKTLKALNILKSIILLILKC